MKSTNRYKKRGLVLAASGAKGMYEAGVIYALHITSMDFDIIAGSSFGALNSVFYAEYLLKKHALPDRNLDNPESVVEALEQFVLQFHHKWLQLPAIRIIDDSDTGPLGMLVQDLYRLDVNIGSLLKMWWTWLPERRALPSITSWMTMFRMQKWLIDLLGGAGEINRILKYHRSDTLTAFLRTYLARFGLDHSLAPEDSDQKIIDLLSGPVAPLQEEYLKGDVLPVGEAHPDENMLVDPKRTIRDYKETGIELLLTRTNYRTGQLEISNYLPPENFIRHLERLTSQLQSIEPDKIPPGSLRLQVPGNPNAIKAGLASSRFPGVFKPYPIENIYPLDDPENVLLYNLLTNWITDEQTIMQLKDAFLSIHADQADALHHWTSDYDSWRDSEMMRKFFPKENDIYVDGGVAESLPYKSVVDAFQEWIEQEKHTKQNYKLDLYIVNTHIEPHIEMDQNEFPSTVEVIQRVLDIQGTAVRSNNKVAAEKITHSGDQVQELGELMLTFMDILKVNPNLFESVQQQMLEGKFLELLQELVPVEFLEDSKDTILERYEEWIRTRINYYSSPEYIVVNIFPDKMPIGTTQITEKLGYRKDNAIEMLTQGCYKTLWSIRNHLERVKYPDEQDIKSLKLARKWMGIENWPENEWEVRELSKNWRCQRTSCLYNNLYCARGARSTVNA